MQCPTECPWTEGIEKVEGECTYSIIELCIDERIGEATAKKVAESTTLCAFTCILFVLSTYCMSI